MIAFDMGGTSTDVARWDGDFEYLFEHEVGDAHLVAPALAIESVAAGGGSICALRRHSAQGGAGERGSLARAGLLRRGRAADADRRQPAPRPSRPRPLRDPPGPGGGGAGSRRLRARMGDADPGPEAMLAGLLEIADERMAEAIRSISLRRGYDPAGYALVAFGGAGAQHACAVAELLGIGDVLVPADAGLLSRAGAGSGGRRALRPAAGARAAGPGERGADRRLARRARPRGCGRGPRGGDRGRGDRRPAPAAEPRVSPARRRRSRSITGRMPRYEPAFAAAYQEIYGYAPEGRAIELESIRVVASSRLSEDEDARVPDPEPSAAVPAGVRRCWTGGDWRDVPFFDRSRLIPGAAFTGPALVFESHSATLVADRWQGAGGQGGKSGAEAWSRVTPWIWI